MTYVEARHAFVPTGRDEGCAECSFTEDSRIHRVGEELTAEWDFRQPEIVYPDWSGVQAAYVKAFGGVKDD